MSHGFQFMAGVNRQWHKMDGTWNPTDPAGFVQPDPLPNNAQPLHAARQQRRELAARHGQRPELRPDLDEVPHELRRHLAAAVGCQPGGQPDGPGRSLVGIPVVPAVGHRSRRVASTGRPRSRWPTGPPQPNPLATRNRYVFGDRGEGQVQAPAITTVGLKIGKIFRFDRYSFEVAGNIFNLLNAGDYTQYNYNSAYQTLELQLPADGQPAAGARVPADPRRPLLTRRRPGAATPRTGSASLRGDAPGPAPADHHRRPGSSTRNRRLPLRQHAG